MCTDWISINQISFIERVGYLFELVLLLHVYNTFRSIARECSLSQRFRDKSKTFFEIEIGQMFEDFSDQLIKVIFILTIFYFNEKEREN